MKFGGVDKPGEIDFSLTDDHPDTKGVFSKNSKPGRPKVYLGMQNRDEKIFDIFIPPRLSSRDTTGQRPSKR